MHRANVRGMKAITINILRKRTINLIIFSLMHKSQIINIKINKSQNKKRLDQALTNLLNKYSRSQIKILLLNKNVKKSNKIITDASYKVVEGEDYTISIPYINSSNFKAEDIPLDIVFEDNDIIVVNKPHDMVTHPAPGNSEKTLVNALLHYTNNNLSTIGQNNRPGIVHRLDKNTSGLIVIAKNNLSHSYLSDQFRSHTIKRKYYALVWGVPNNQTIKGYISRNKVNRKKMMLNKNNNGKYSETEIKLKNNYNICSLIECKLKTGKTHQVRLHLTSIGSPIVGDQLYGKNKIGKYGKDKKYFNRFLLLKNFDRQALHAYKLGFIHPNTKKYIEFQSKLPDDMLKLLEYILKY